MFEVKQLVIQEYEGYPDSRTILRVYQVDTDAGLVFASNPKERMSRVTVWALDGTEAVNVNPWSKGGGTLRHLRDGELEEMEAERKEREEIAKEADELAEQFAGEPTYCGSDDLEGLAALAIKYRRALREIAEGVHSDALALRVIAEEALK